MLSIDLILVKICVYFNYLIVFGRWPLNSSNNIQFNIIASRILLSMTLGSDSGKCHRNCDS